MNTLIVEVLGSPTTTLVLFGAMAATELAWTVRATRAGHALRTSVARSAESGAADTPAAEAWLSRWAQLKADGSPVVERGRIVLAAEAPQLRARAAPSPLAVAPGLLTALGVLGTFLGIHGGLGSIDFASLSNAQELLGAARGLLDGMKTAFATSVAGLGCAAAFMLLLAVTRQVQIRAAAAEARRWEGLTRPPGAGGLGAAAATMASAVTEMNTNLAGLFGRMEQQLAEMAALRSDQGDSLIRQVVKEFREEALEPLAARLDESAAISRRSAEAVESLEASLGGISTRLAGSVELLERFQRETHAQLQAFSRELAGTLTQTGAVIREAVDESISGMARQREAFEESAVQAAATFRGIRTDLEASLETLKEANLAVLDRAEAAYGKQAAAIEAVGTQAALTMRTARAELEAGLQRSSETLKTELERFREAYQEQLQAYLARQANALDEVLDRQRRGLQTVVEQLSTSFTEEYLRRKELSAEVAATISQLKDGAETLDRLAQSLGLHSTARMAQLIELSREMSGQTTALEAAYRDLSAQHQRAVSTSVEQLSGYLREFQQQQTTSVNHLDDASGRLIEGLYQAADVLVTATTARRTA